MTKSKGIIAPRGTRAAWVEQEQGKHLCGCGCGDPVHLRPEHYPTPPGYLHGHNRRGKSKPQAEAQPCKCGCGQLAGSGKEFISGHNGRGKARTAAVRSAISTAMSGEQNHRFGKRATNFKGRIYHTDGYVLIWTPDHPHASNGRVLEHRLVVESHLRCWEPGSSHLVRLADGQLYLRREIEVHHENGVKDDNRFENLTPLTGAEHARLHAQMKAH